MAAVGDGFATCTEEFTAVCRLFTKKPVGSLCRYTSRDGANKYAVKVLNGEICKEAEIAERAGQHGIAPLVFHRLAAKVDGVAKVVFVMEAYPMDMYECMWEREGTSLVGRLSLMAGVAEKVAALHELGVVHRDLKPENVVCTEDLDTRLIDFEGATNGGICSFCYASPERLDTAMRLLDASLEMRVAASKVDDCADDVFSLGCMLFEVLAYRNVCPDCTPAFVKSPYSEQYKVLRAFYEDTRRVSTALQEGVDSVEGVSDDFRKEAYALLSDVLLSKPEERMCAADFQGRVVALQKGIGTGS